ncbi:MAG: AAA family ATPase [Pseudomonadota bacterium]
MKLQDVSRELFLENNWQMPDGLQQDVEADSLNYSIAECQQAKRQKLDPKVLKALFQKCWEQSDSQPAFAAALKEHGLILAKGDRRGFVAVDHTGEVYSISRWVGIKAKEVRARLGSPDNLPRVDEALGLLAAHLPEDLAEGISSTKADYGQKREGLEQQRKALATEHRKARAALRHAQEQRSVKKSRQLVATLPTGFKAVWARMTGQYQKLQENLIAELEAEKSLARNQRQDLVQLQLSERRTLQQEIRALEFENEINAESRRRNCGKALVGTDFSSRGDLNFPSIDPRQPLIIPEDEKAQSLKAKIRRNPKAILDVITNNKACFTKRDIVRGLSNHIDDHLELKGAIDVALKSGDLIVLEESPKQIFTTKEIQRLERAIRSQSTNLSGITSHRVKTRHIDAAIGKQNAKLKKIAGASLSDEQEKAIRYVLAPGQLKAVVGYAGAGKSTMLESAKTAFEVQGYRVLGAAISGKAADSLEKSAGIESRTLASFEHSWKSGFHKLGSGDVLIIDEAGMVGSKQLLRFIEEAKDIGCKLIMVGDYHQLQPIAAGTPFKDIVHQVGASRLTEIRRQTEDWQRDASYDLANLNTAEAIGTYRKHGFVHTAEDELSAIAKLVEDYVNDINQRGYDASRLALAHRRKDVHLINQSVRKALIEQGTLSDEKLIKANHGQRAFATGDRILFTRNDRELGLRNGMLGTIEAIDNNEIVVMLDSDGGSAGRQMGFSFSKYRSIEHGYATTIHKSQGATIDRSFVLSSTTMDKHLTYVALSRHKEEVFIYSADLGRQKLMQCNSPAYLRSKKTMRLRT